MGAIRNIAIFVLTVSFLTFVAFFGRLPAFRNTPIGALHRFLWIHIPKFLGRLDRLITGGRLAPSLARLGNYLLYQKHPVVLSIFIALVTGSAILFLPPTWSYISTTQKILVVLLLPLPYIFIYICQRSGPGSAHLIRPETLASHLRHYPFDHILYQPNNICKTCALPKPARSKHCSFCGTCVARCDHHCVWVNNCVGRGNHKYFLSLLLSVAILLAYGSYLAYFTLMPEVQWHFENYPEWYLSDPSGRHGFIGSVQDSIIHFLDILSTGLLIGGVSRAGVGLLCTFTAPLPLGLLAYHVYLIWAGMTTNETGKWSDWREDMQDGLVFVASIKRPGYDSATAAQGMLNGIGGHHLEEVDAEFEWPHRSRQFLVRTNDGHPPRHVHPEIQELVIEDSWRRCWHLGDVENIYDLGFWGNLKEMLTN